MNHLLPFFSLKWGTYENNFFLMFLLFSFNYFLKIYDITGSPAPFFHFCCQSIFHLDYILNIYTCLLKKLLKCMLSLFSFTIFSENDPSFFFPISFPFPFSCHHFKFLRSLHMVIYIWRSSNIGTAPMHPRTVAAFLLSTERDSKPHKKPRKNRKSSST